MAQKYKELMDAMSEALAEGPRTMRELKTLFADWPEWQVVNVTKYLGCVTAPGAHFFDPHTVYHPDDPNRPVPAVDTFLDGYFNEADPRTATETLDAAEAAGFTVAETKIAYTRLGIRAERDGRKWVRTRRPIDEDAPTVPAGVLRGNALATQLSPRALANAAMAMRAAMLGTEGETFAALRARVVVANPPLADRPADETDYRLRAGLGRLLDLKLATANGDLYALTDEGIVTRKVPE